MKFESDIFGVTALFAAAHSIAIAVFLISRAGNKGKTSLFLGLSQISGAMILLSSLLTTTNLYKLFPQLIGVPYPFIFLSGFFTLLYISSLMENPADSGKKMLWFAAGPAVGIGLSVPFFIMDGTARAEYLSFIFTNHNYPAYDWGIWLLGLVYNWTILTAALLRIRRHRKALMSERSDTEGLDLRILSREIILLLGCWLVITLLSVFSFNRRLVDLSIIMSALFPAVFLLVFCYTYLLNLAGTVRLAPKSNLLKDKLPRGQLAEMYGIIRKEMETNKHYLNPELTLPLLADKTSFYRNELSEIINSQARTSFYHFVNSYRIEHFKNLLIENRDTNILDLAFESGFNSKGAFYNAFKRVTGITPRQFLTADKHSSAIFPR